MSVMDEKAEQNLAFHGSVQADCTNFLAAVRYETSFKVGQSAVSLTTCKEEKPNLVYIKAEVNHLCKFRGHQRSNL